MSRIKDPEYRISLEIKEPGWEVGLTFYSEQLAVSEFEWLLDHNKMREYILVIRQDPLDDELPFGL